MSGPYQIEELQLADRKLFVVRGPTLNHFLPRTFADADMLRSTLNAAYAAGRAGADKGLREALNKILNHWDDLQQARAALAATEPAFAKQLRESVAQLENKP